MPARKPTAKRKRPAAARSNAKGTAFELRVQRVLAKARKLSKHKLTYKIKPKLRLHTGEEKIPDFQVKVASPHKEQHYCIECQKRKRFTKPIVDKIRGIRTLHRAKTFIFVYAGKLEAELQRVFALDGIEARTLEEFEAFMHDEAVAVDALWAHTSFVTTRCIPADIERLSFLSKTVLQLNSHPDGAAQMEEFLKQVDSRSDSDGGEGRTL